MRIIAGPCQHETLEQSLEIARECKRVCDKHNIEYYFKASFDKANRSSMQGKRGLGLVIYTTCICRYETRNQRFENTN